MNPPHPPSSSRTADRKILFGSRGSGSGSVEHGDPSVIRKLSAEVNPVDAGMARREDEGKIDG